MNDIKPQKKPKYDVNWYADKYQSLVVWRNWLLLITFLSLLGVVLMTLSQMYMLPLKAVKPFVVQIDDKTGQTQVITNDSVRDYNANDELIQYFAMQYIYARENYDFRLVEGEYEKVKYFSTRQTYQSFRQDVAPENESSPYKMYGVKTTKNVELVSFSRLNKNKSSREDNIIQAKLLVQLSSGTISQSYYVQVTMSCAFNKSLVLTDVQRLVNPLGFQVLSYNVDSYREVSQGQ